VLFLDSSVVLASLNPDETHHVICGRLLTEGGPWIYGHALAETFSTLTGGRLAQRLGPAVAARLIADSVLPFVQVQTLTPKELMSALTACEARGVRGGAVYDWLHLAAARKAKADAFVTLNLRDFQAFSRPGDPVIQAPDAA
jgi:predicted nucleic acid-binding protein